MDEGIDTRLINGFLDAGKTFYIRESIQNDYFHKYGTTLILCFEQGEEEYDLAALTERRTSVAYHDGTEDVLAFCRRSIREHRPDRIYVEMNAMTEGLREQLPEELRVTFSVTLLDWATMPLYFRNYRQLIQRMVASSQQVVFRGCPSRELLAPYSQPFRLMNQSASYLRQDPMGYHERAFDLFLPFSLEGSEISIDQGSYLPFWLDALDHPEHYQGKILRFTDPLELRRIGEEESWSAGRVVMVCCMADLQFMGLALEDYGKSFEGGWITLEAAARVERDEYGRPRLKLRPERICRAPAPDVLIMDGNSTKTRL